MKKLFTFLKAFVRVITIIVNACFWCAVSVLAIYVIFQIPGIGIKILMTSTLLGCAYLFVFLPLYFSVRRASRITEQLITNLKENDPDHWLIKGLDETE